MVNDLFDEMRISYSPSDLDRIDSVRLQVTVRHKKK